MRARALPAAASQVTSTQALELLDDDIETVPETEMYGESVDRMKIVMDDITETQPPTPSQMPTLAPMLIRDTPPDLGAPNPSQQGTRESFKCIEALLHERLTSIDKGFQLMLYHRRIYVYCN